MRVLMASFLCGFVFACGLLVSGMTDPVKVLGFLDVLGRWDPTLAFVMIGALAVSAAGFAFAKRRAAPVLAAASMWPTQSSIDRPLVFGAVMFGIGWGLVGLCPGPAITNLGTLSPPVALFVAAMLLGMLLHTAWQRYRRSGFPSQAGKIANATEG